MDLQQWLAAQFPGLKQLQPLGSGGQRWALSAKHSTYGDVVLKLYHPFADLERAKREIVAVQAIASPRVPPIFDFGTIPSQFGMLLWVLEQLIPGTNLRQRLTMKQRLDNNEVLRLGYQMLEALAASADCHIVHRDVKPENIIFGDAGDYWLIDFGFARHLDLASLTATAAPFGPGTLGYSPPEQMRNRKQEVDGRADLFALGVTLYECVEGVNPFRKNARDDREVLRRMEADDLKAITRQIGSNSEFRNLVCAMTRRTRSQRPRNVGEALVWMREICESEGVL